MIARKAPLKPSAPRTPDHHDSEVFAERYRLLRPIRRGMESTVHEAEDVTSGKRVAVKLPYANLSDSDALRDQFLSAARAVAQLTHPNVVEIYDFGVTREGTPYIVMELLKGETLDMLVTRRGALPPADACEIMVQVLTGLAAAHRHGVVHRSLDPSNIFLTYPRPDAPLVRLLEFGIAKTVVAIPGYEAVLGTTAYMAPEQARTADVGPLADVYSAGVILYELLAGEAPFAGDPSEIVKRVVSGQWKPLSNVNPAVPRLLTLAVSAAMATDPGRRIASARIFARQLAPYMSHAPTHSAARGPVSTDALILGATSAVPEIRLMSSSDLPDPSRPPRDFPSLQLAKVAGKPRGEPLADSLLQSPIIPKAPTAPKISISPAIRDVEMWSNAPGAIESDPVAAARPTPPLDATPAAVAMSKERDPVFDSGPSPQEESASLEPPHWSKGAWAAAFGVGVGALIAWLSHLG